MNDVVDTVGTILVTGTVYLWVKEKFDFIFVAARILTKRAYREFLCGVETTCYFILDHLPNSNTGKIKNESNNPEVFEVVDVQQKNYELHV